MKAKNNNNNVSIMEDYMKEEASAFIDSSKRIKRLHEKVVQQKVRIILFCGGPFSGKRRHGRELARKIAARGNSTYCFQIDLEFELKSSREESIEMSIITSVLQEMEKDYSFEDEIEELMRSDINLRTFSKFFSEKTHRDSQFVFVFDDADIVAMQNKEDSFLNFLKKWTERCKNVFVVLTTQFQFKIYRNCLTYCCKPLTTEDAISFLKNEIQITRGSFPDSTIEDPSMDKCKDLVELVKCWPFLVMAVAHELVNYSADQMVELLTSTPLLTLSNEAASKTDQLDYMLKSMVDQLSNGLKEMTSFFPDVGKDFTVQDMMEVSQYEYKSFADAKQGCLERLSIRSLLGKPTKDLDFYEFIDFMDEHVADNALDSFQPSEVKKNELMRILVNLVTTSLKNAVKNNEDEVKRCRQQAASEFKEMVSQMKMFSSVKHSKAQQIPSCEEVIQAAEDFLKRATRQPDPTFRKEAESAKVMYCRRMQKTESQDSAIHSDENNSGSETEEPTASVTIRPHSGGASVGNTSDSQYSLISTSPIDGVENPLALGGYLKDAREAQPRYPQGPQLTAVMQESSDGSNGGRRIVPSGCDSFPPMEPDLG